MAQTKKIRFRNRHDGLRIVYDESGTKKEIVPNGTILLEPEWGSRFRCLERVEQEPKTISKKKSKAEEEAEKE